MDSSHSFCAIISQFYHVLCLFEQMIRSLVRIAPRATLVPTTLVPTVTCTPSIVTARSTSSSSVLPVTPIIMNTCVRSLSAATSSPPSSSSPSSGGHAHGEVSAASKRWPGQLPCWQCGTATRELFCKQPKCGVLQPPNFINFFQTFKVYDHHSSFALTLHA